MARTIKILGILLILCLSISEVKATEVIKAEPIFNTAPVIKTHIVDPPSKPMQTVTQPINYVPKINTSTNIPVVKNATLNISAPKINPVVNQPVVVKPTSIPVAKPVVQPVKPQTITQPQSQTQVVPQMVSFQNCTKIFPTDTEKLFYLAIASISANKFTIDEMQSKSGYILFSVLKKQFLLSVANVDKKNAIVKITPTNNNYYFPVGIVNNIFKYIDLNVDTEITKI